jgi:3-deoxy-manno-octulosonate cytidylyltransferase (CMP-KDO synthetase)
MRPRRDWGALLGGSRGGGAGLGPCVAEAVTIIIPARMASTRFPGKVLAARTGRPLIQHVWEAVGRAECAGRVVVATDDRRVLEVVQGFGGEAVLTSPEHENGTSRLAEAARLLGLGDRDIVVNVQGDEPELEPGIIDASVGALKGSACPVATAAIPLDPEEAGNPNLVKVVLRADGRALYFSRAAIPHVRDGRVTPFQPPLRHVGIYIFRRPFLETYIKLPPAPLERTESLEQLRVLYHGHDIAVAVHPAPAPAGIDTPEQYEAFVARWMASHGR